MSALRTALVIPVYEPRTELVSHVQALAGDGCFDSIILVNDGSSARFDSVFEEALRTPGVRVIRHDSNLGKGAALKSGFRHAMDQVPNLFGIVTADADGQHLPNDILRVARRFMERSDSVVLGVRSFEGDVPRRSQFGNRAARLAFWIGTGQNVTDTQTGLRAIPASLLPEVLDLRGDGYEFELEMLLLVKKRGYVLEEVPIQTVYEKANESSHFRPLRDSFSIGRLLLGSCLSWATGALICGLGAMTAYGLASAQVFSQTIWFAEGLHRAEVFALVSICIFSMVLALTPRYFRAFVLGGILAGTTVAVGPLPVVAVLMFLFSAKVIGERIFNKIDWPITILSGAAILIIVEELLVRAPWNYAWSYSVLLLLPAAIAPRIALKTLKAGMAMFLRNPLPSFAERAALAALALILTAHWLMVMKPEVSADGLAMHLAIADGVAWKHRFAFDIAHNIWAAMPMGGDWCFTWVYLIGGEFAARMLNFAFLLILVALLFQVCRRMVSRAASLWLATLFVATPLVQMVTGSLFIENILAAVIFGAVTSLQRFKETGGRRYLYAAALLFGTGLHIKLGSFAFVLPGLLLLAWQVRRTCSRPLQIYVQIIAVVIAAGAPPYVIATMKTGNPIFPFLNGSFHSALLAKGTSVDETRFHEPLRLGTLFNLAFHTSRYYEGQDGSFGIQYFLLLPAGVLLIGRGGYEAWSSTAVGLGGCLLVLAFQPNLRYLYPALALLHVTIACLLERKGVVGRRFVFCAIAVCLGLDLFLFPSSNWYHKEFYSEPLLTAQRRRLYLQASEPRRLLIENLNIAHPGDAVLLPDDSAIAGLRAPVFRNHWHDQATKSLLDSAHDGNEVLEYVRKWGVQRLLLPVRISDISSRQIREFSSVCVEPGLRVGSYYSGYVSEACKQRMRKLEKRRTSLSTMGRVYDDLSHDMELSGKWARGDKFVLASGDTLSYSNSPGATLRFPFQGKVITYVYTAAANRGIARISIDGAPVRDVDLYRSETEWQSIASFAGLSKGPHVFEILVAGRKTQSSSGYYVDVDALVVAP